MLKFWAFIYRTTGWYSPFARLAEYQELKKSAHEIEDLMQKYNVSAKGAMGIFVGSWQAANGFIRPYKYGEDRTNRFRKRERRSKR